MPQLTVYASFLVSHRAGSTFTGCFRQGWNGESGGTAPSNRWTGHIFFNLDDFVPLSGKILESAVLRMTATSWGNSGSYAFWLKKSPFKYADDGSRLDPNDYYPAQEIYDIADYVATPAFARNATQDTALPLDYLNHVMAGYGLATYRRSVYANPSSTEYTREVTDAPQLIITYSESTTACIAPSSAGLSEALSEGDVTGSYSGGAGGTNNAIVGAQFQARESSNDGATWGAFFDVKTISTSSGSGSTNLPPSGTRGNIREYRVRLLGAAGEGWHSGWKTMGQVKRNSLPTAPSVFTAGPALRESGEISLSFSGQTDPDNNIAHQEIQYRIRSVAGVWGAWQALKTATGSGTTTTPTLADGERIQYQTRSVDAFGTVSGWKASNEVIQNSNPTAPTTFTAAPALRESGEISLAWSGQTDVDNNIAHQEIQYRIRSVAGVWGNWQALKTATGSTTTTTPALADGERIQYQTRTVDALGAVSGWKTSNEVIQNSNPTAATTFTASPTIYESGNVNLAWSGPTDPDNNILHQEIQYAIKPQGGAYGAWQALKTATGSGTTTVPTLDRGAAIKYQSRTVDALGEVSDWVQSNEVVRNSVPVTPEILFPGAGKTTYNAQPYVGLSISMEPNGQTQTLFYSVNGGAAQNAGAVAAGTKMLQMPINAPGNHTLRFWLQDGLGAVSGEASVTVTVAANSYARTIMQGTLLWDAAAGHRTSVEILELKSRVNVMRAYCGLEGISLPYEEATGDNSIKHFHTWMDNMIALYQGVADTGAVSGASVPVRVTKERNAPSAAVINQVRSMIGSL